MSLTNWLLCCVIVALILCSAKVDGNKKKEYSHSTSTAGMVILLQLEANFIAQLSLYADELRHKLEVAQSGLEKLRTESEGAYGQSEQYLSNPLHAFALIRRMHEDWHEWRDFMESPLGWSQVAFINKHAASLPSKIDLEEACEAIDRLQKVYDLKASDLTTGLINGQQYNASLSVLDSYALGQHFHRRQYYQLAEEWFTETFKSLVETPFSTGLSADYCKLLHFYGSAFFKMKYYSISLPIFEKVISIGNTSNAMKCANMIDEIKNRLEHSKMPSTPTQKLSAGNYERGCRGEFPKASNLHCTYNSTNSPFLRYAPLKMELMALDPYMALYHDVLAPNEIRELQILATPKLSRAGVINYGTGKQDVVKSRTSKSTSLPDTHNALTVRLNERISDMTGFDMLGSDVLQVMNYGLGGNYDAHYDYFDESDNEYGNRIATVIFYLTDVEQGGATVFPRLEQAVFPRKGTAIIWYNLKNDGECDKRTLHAACPVIVGSKWVSVKWIRERQQLFKRPCYKI